jgi:ABC-2 type transport system permease protein
MTTIYWAASDSLTLIGRNIRHTLRSVDALTTAVALPVMILLLFTYVFGGAIDAPGDYLDYVVPGIIVLAAGFGSASTAVAVCEDMTTGVVDRFRSLPIAAPAVLVGHVVASMLRNLLSTALVLAVALAIGFDPHAGVAEWLAVFGLLLAFMAAISWVGACVGLVAGSAEAAGAFSFVVMFLPYVSSAFVPTATMPAGLRWVADHQPITPLVDALRALTMGAPAGADALTGLAWCAAIALAGCAGAAALFRRRATRP